MAVLKVVAVAEDVESQLIFRRSGLVVFCDTFEEFQVALCPNHFPDEVSPLRETARLGVRRFRNLSTHADEVRRDTVHVDGDGSREILNRAGRVCDLMAVHSRDGGVDPSKELLLFLAILLSSRAYSR